MFAKKPTVKPVEKRSDTKSKEVKLVDQKRAYNIEIRLKKWKMSHNEIRDAIITMDTEKLTPEIVEVLRGCVPTAQEIKLVCGYKGNTKLLSFTDMFFRSIAGIPKCQMRLDCLGFYHNFPSALGYTLG